MKDGYHGLSLRQQQLPLIMYYSYITVVDPDLQIRGGGGGEGGLQKMFFGLSGLSFVWK